MEDVGGRRVVDDYDLVEVTAEPAEVLDVVPPVEDTRFPEETTPERTPLVQKVRHRVCILEPLMEKKKHVKPRSGSLYLALITIIIVMYFNFLYLYLHV